MARKMLIEGVGCICGSEVGNLMSLGWLIDRPSVLLWADRIFISERDLGFIESGYQYLQGTARLEALAVLFGRLKKEGIIIPFSPNKYLLPISQESIKEQVNSDIRMYGVGTGERDANGKAEPTMVSGEFGSFCHVMIGSIYTNMLLSRLMGCSCLMDASKAMYVKERFGSASENELFHGEAFDTLYRVSIPEIKPIDYRILCSPSQHDSCARRGDCDKDLSKNVNRFVDDILVKRENKEIRGLSTLVERLEQEVGGDSDAVVSAAARDIARSQRRVYGCFDSIKRWATLVGDVSSAIAVSSFITGQPTASTITASIATASAVSAFVMDRYERNQSWKITYAEKWSVAPVDAFDGYRSGI